MKATAKAIRGSVRATATTTGGLMGVAYVMPQAVRPIASAAKDVSAFAHGVPQGIRPTAKPTDERGLITWLHVEPTEPQQLVWLTPQVGIDYTITTSTGLKWNII